MRRLGVVAVMVLMASLLSASPALARDIEWCAEDPVFHVLGANFRVTTSIHLPASSVTAIVYDVTLPSDAEDATRYTLTGRLPTTVNLHYDGAPSSDGTFAVAVNVTVSPSADTVLTASGHGVTVTSAPGNSLTFTVSAK